MVFNINLSLQPGFLLTHCPGKRSIFSHRVMLRKHPDYCYEKVLAFPFHFLNSKEKSESNVQAAAAQDETCRGKVPGLITVPPSEIIIINQIKTTSFSCHSLFVQSNIIAENLPITLNDENDQDGD